MSHIHMDIEHLSFAYQKDHPVLHDICLQAREHDSIGLIGANGVGKSTLLKLLVGLSLGFEGTVRIEEIPLRKQTLPRIREKIGYYKNIGNRLYCNLRYNSDNKHC